MRFGPKVRGLLVVEGERHGRPVHVRMGQSTQVAVAAAAPQFEFRSRDGRLKAGKGAPEAVAEALKAVPNATRWNGVHGGGGKDGITVERKGAQQGDWLLDLWVAERLADAVP